MEEELPALAYIHEALFGIPDSERRDHIVVDEAQELTPLLCAVIGARCRTPSMTLVGDLAQAIQSPTPSSTWREVLGSEPDDESIAEFTFEKSYRSTCEIVALARWALERACEPVPLPEPVLRHGPKPELSGFGGFDEMIDAIVQAFDDMSARVRTIAVITPDAQEAARTHDALCSRGVNLCLLASPDASRSGAGVVAPVEVVRGLEFDGVIVSGASQDAFPASSPGARRLYVALTRALHEIRVFWAGEPSPLLPSSNQSVRSS
jgi:DNA helicase-2/ATP-dependent DNA helicase PcrA